VLGLLLDTSLPSKPDGSHLGTLTCTGYQNRYPCSMTKCADVRCNCSKAAIHTRSGATTGSRLGNGTPKVNAEWQTLSAIRFGCYLGAGIITYILNSWSSSSTNSHTQSHPQRLLSLSESLQR
jgi:hypothetical protein